MHSHMNAQARMNADARVHALHTVQGARANATAHAARQGTAGHGTAPVANALNIEQ